MSGHLYVDVYAEILFFMVDKDMTIFFTKAFFRSDFCSVDFLTTIFMNGIFSSTISSLKENLFVAKICLERNFFPTIRYYCISIHR